MLTPTKTTHTLRSADGLTAVRYTPDADGTVLIEWSEIDQGDCESGPSCRSGSERLPIAAARDDYRKARRAGMRPALEAA